MPDYNKYLNYQGFLENYKKNLIGPNIKNFDELKKYIIKYKNSPNLYSTQYNFKIKQYLDKYYDLSIKNSSKLLSDFVASKL